MTAPSPTSVKYQFVADYWTAGGWKPLPVTDISPSSDKDRRAYTAATLTLSSVSATVLAALDPRTVDPATGGQVRWRITQLDLAGNTIGWLPRTGTLPGAYARMFVRGIRRRLESVTVDVEGGETMILDRINLTSKTIAAHPVYTGADLANWTLDEVFGNGTVTAADAAATAYLARKPDRVELASGDNYFRLTESDMSSHGVRLLDLWGLGWYVADRDHPPTFPGAQATAKLASFADETLPVDVDPIIIDLEEAITRDGDWADGVIVRGDIPSGSYTERWEYAAEKTAHTKGLVIEIGGAAPSSNLAASILSRTVRRGRDLTVTARARLDVLPGMTLEAHLVGDVLTGLITSVKWDFQLGTMNLQVQSAASTDPDVAITEARTRALNAQGAYNAATRLARSLAPAPPDVKAEAWQASQMIGLGL
ncbi:hypothetical protein ACIP5T_17260 [Microbacterium sp. NPDC088619]|uniref:hypothetical protein n=1 Tax=Microbacterium sp. NPDC088619 TaxID=3364196 RepID=UPI0038012AB9